MQRTRVTVERLYTSRVKLDHSLVGLDERGVVGEVAESEAGPEDEPGYAFSVFSKPVAVFTFHE